VSTASIAQRMPTGIRDRMNEVVSQLAAAAGLIVVFVALSFASPYFLTSNNLFNVCVQIAVVAILAVGQTMVILTAGIDLSVGSVAGLSGVVGSMAMANWGMPMTLGIVVGILVGAVAGTGNGLLVTRAGLPPFIATLGMMSIARGCALLFTDGRPVSGFDAAFRGIATAKLAGIPSPVYVTIAVYLFAHFVLSETRFGRYVYSMGGNEEATRLSGVNVALHKTLVYGVSGLASAVAAVLLTARLNSAQPIAGIMYELDAIAATVIGGTSLMGGEGTLGGTLVGALIMGVLRNGLNLLGVSSFLQQIVIGGVIVVAVLLDTVLKRKHRT
jgi:ribose transport system permease protein